MAHMGTQRANCTAQRAKGKNIRQSLNKGRSNIERIHKMKPLAYRMLKKRIEKLSGVQNGGRPWRVRAHREREIRPAHRTNLLRNEIPVELAAWPLPGQVKDLYLLLPIFWGWP
jgi:hypothetical protein